MLSFFVNHLSPANELVFDRETNRSYLLIYKNGTRSILDMVRSHPERFSHFLGADATEFMQNNHIRVLTVFLRDPIERFFSGLHTQQITLGIDINKTLKVWETSNTVHMFDWHTVPQFSYLLRSTNLPGMEFNFLKLSELNRLYPICPKINVNREKIDVKSLPPSLMDKIVHYFTEDIVLYDQFLGRTADLNTIIDQIRKESTFSDEYRSYYKILTYL